MHYFGIVSLDEVGPVAVADKEAGKFVVAQPRKHCRVGNLVAVQMQNRQYRAIAYRVQEFVGVPASCQGTRLCLAVTYDARGEQIGIIEYRTISVRERVTEF